jgi:hypothetical protein
VAKYEITTELTDIKYNPETDSYTYTETIKSPPIKNPLVTKALKGIKYDPLTGRFVYNNNKKEKKEDNPYWTAMGQPKK